MNCLDAETLASWFDGSLKGAALEDVRAHVTGCERCQMLVGAMGRTRAAVAVPVQERAPRRWLAWAIPLTAAATAFAVWVAIPEQRNVPAVTPASAPTQKQEEARPAAPPASPAAATPAETRQVNGRAVAQPLPLQGTQESTASPPAAPAPAAAEPSAAAPVLAPRAEARVLDQQQRAAAVPAAPGATPGNEGGATAQAPFAATVTVTGEVPGASIETLCGRRWTRPPSDVIGKLTAGSSPSPNVCWVVGRGGVVRRSTNGQTWQRVPFPDMADLSGVQASDARSARVSTADGRSFGTSDGGMTWVPQ